MRASRFGLADPGHEKGLCQARCFLAEAGERVGEQTAPTSIQAPLELASASRPRGSAFVGVRKASSLPHTIRKEDRMPIILWLLGVPLVVIVLLYLLNIV